MPMEVRERREPPSQGRFHLFDLGFRPFFLGAAVVAVAWMALWVLTMRGLPVESYYGTYRWHAHEMIFGYTVAVMAGFLLTAVQNWTDIPTVHGAPLAALFGLWCAARVAAFLPGIVPPLGNAVLDLAFLPALGLALAVPLVRGGAPRHVVFLLLLGLLEAADLLIHLDVLGVAEGAAARGTVLGLGVVVLAIAMIGGRVFPMFTARLPDVHPKSRRPLEAAAMGSLVLFLGAVLFHPGSQAAGLTALLAAACHGARLWGWYDRRIWAEPLVWVLHLGYAWLVAGFLLWSLAAFGVFPHALAVHAFTAGAIGVLTLGMMARVALGHTERPLKAARPTVAAFVLVNLAALARVVLPALSPALYGPALVAAGALWLMAFVLFLAVYVPVLTGPDFQPGNQMLY